MSRVKLLFRIDLILSTCLKVKMYTLFTCTSKCISVYSCVLAQVHALVLMYVYGRGLAYAYNVSVGFCVCIYIQRSDHRQYWSPYWADNHWTAHYWSHPDNWIITNTFLSLFLSVFPSTFPLFATTTFKPQPLLMEKNINLFLSYMAVIRKSVISSLLSSL